MHRKRESWQRRSGGERDLGNKGEFEGKATERKLKTKGGHILDTLYEARNFPLHRGDEEIQPRSIAKQEF